MKISAKLVMDLRKRTGVGMMECKKALKKNEGDIDKAIDYLRERGLKNAAKKADRETTEGIIYSYIHSNNKIGVMLEMSCETDFVANTDNFKALCHDISLHIAATNPISLSEDDIDAAVLEKEKEIYKKQALNDGKPEKIVDKIVDGRVKKFKQENCLVNQKFIKDEDKTVEEVIKGSIAKLGENISIKRFIRYQLGE